MTRAFLDMTFEDDAGERLAAWLVDTQRAVPVKNMAAAIKTAGTQLEWLKPSIMGGNSRGKIIAGAVAEVARGGVLIVLADADKVLVATILPHPRRREAVREMMQRPRRASFSLCFK